MNTTLEQYIQGIQNISGKPSTSAKEKKTHDILSNNLKTESQVNNKENSTPNQIGSFKGINLSYLLTNFLALPFVIKKGGDKVEDSINHEPIPSKLNQLKMLSRAQSWGGPVAETALVNRRVLGRRRKVKTLSKFGQ